MKLTATSRISPTGTARGMELAAEQASVSALREAAAGCRSCDLWKHATQTVFGEGSSSVAQAGLCDESGEAFQVGAGCGRRIASDLAPHVVATVHPSSILRARDVKERKEQMGAFIRDLEVAAALMREFTPGEFHATQDEV